MTIHANHTLTASQRIGIPIVAFLGWFFGRVQIGITGVAKRVIAILMAPDTSEREIDK